MNLKEIGEFGLIRRIKPLCFIRKENIIKGIGDDCAVYEIDRKRAALFTTDMLVENIHFLRNKISPFELGYKTMAVNLSDISAMGGKPSDAFLSIAIPDNITVEYIDELYRGMIFACKKYNVNILGGDTTGSKKDLVLNIALTGEIQKNKILYRHNAKIGDKIYVNGYLGDSSAGLDIILKNINIDKEIKNYLIKCHNMPDIYIDEGIFLSETGAVNSCIDLSDGISSDLAHICEESSCGALIYEKSLPVSDNLKKFAEIEKKNPIDIVLSGGEDYKLLFTVKKDCSRDLEKKYFKKFKKDLFCIGEIIEGNDIVLKLENGKTKSIIPSGWNHFHNNSVAIEGNKE